jgi:hypothetical protein
MVGLVSTGFALRIEDLRPLILRLPVTQSLTHSLIHSFIHYTHSKLHN